MVFICYAIWIKKIASIHFFSWLGVYRLHRMSLLSARTSIYISLVVIFGFMNLLFGFLGGFVFCFDVGHTIFIVYRHHFKLWILWQ